MMSSRLILLTAALLGAVSLSHAYFITVDAHSEECFFDRVEAGTKMGKYYKNEINLKIKLTKQFGWHLIVWLFIER